MAIISIHSSDGSYRGVSVQPLTCPACGTQMAPEYLCYDHMTKAIFCRCRVSGCGCNFILSDLGGTHCIMENHPLSEEQFSDVIHTISPMFVKIYNEAYAAEQMSLMEICGVGYRKALEFLIKDYVSEEKDSDLVESIKKSRLMQCIDNFVTDRNVKEVSKRAVWLGNDETHYIRKWEEKDVHDLKGLIRLTIRWIEQEKETAKILSDMPEGR